MTDTPATTPAGTHGDAEPGGAAVGPAQHGAAEHAAGEHGHDDIHLPPNSWSPISLALAMTALFIGFIVSVWLVIVGAIWTAASIAAWVMAARTEFAELPE